MKLIESKAELILQKEGLEGVYKQIELCGRTCYKSEDKITKDSAKGFVERMIKSNHLAMLEHGTIYLMCRADEEGPGLDKYDYNKYSKFVYKDFNSYVTTNLRVLVENKWLNDLQFICEPTEFHEKRYTLRFITDRGVSHELVRHRVFSFAQESTRYCNYSKKNKFGKELTFIIPSWYEEKDSFLKNEFDRHLERTESLYMWLIEKEMSPQQARQVLPNALKTEICMTGFASDWRFFFDLRYYGETGKPHPDMELLAGKARNEFIKAGLWNNIMACPTKFNKDDTERKN